MHQTPELPWVSRKYEYSHPVSVNNSRTEPRLLMLTKIIPSFGKLIESIIEIILVTR